MNRAQAEFILKSMRELTSLRRDYVKHLQKCAQIQEKQLNATIAASSEGEQSSSSDNGTSLTEPEIPLPHSSSGRKPIEEKTALTDGMVTTGDEPI